MFTKVTIFNRWALPIYLNKAGSRKAQIKLSVIELVAQVLQKTNMYKKFGAITSSQDPEQVANTVKGLVVSFSAVIILVAQQFFHIGLTSNDVLSFATEASFAAGAVWTLYGLVMKVLVYFFKKPQTE